MKTGPALEKLLSATFGCWFFWLFPFISETQITGAPLSQVREVRGLAPHRADLGLPVQIRGYVTYWDREWDILFVQDQTGGIFVRTQGEDFSFAPGTVVDLEGRTGAGDFAPIVINPRIEVLEVGVLPTPSSRSYEELVHGAFDSQWIQVSGVIRSMRFFADQHLEMDLVSGSGGRIKLWLPGRWTKEFPKHLLHATAIVRGVCGTEFNAQRQLVGVKLFVPDLEEIRVIEAAASAGVLPQQPIASLLQFDPLASGGQRFRLEGTVTLKLQNGWFYLQDESGATLVKAEQESQLKSGDRVRAVGFPAPSQISPILEDVLYEVLGHGPLPEPIKVAPDLAMLLTNESRYITIEGELIDYIAGRDPLLVVKAGEEIFHALLPDFSLSQLPPLKKGSLVEVSGICSFSADQWYNPRSFKILLTRPGDFRVMREPSWWTLGRVLAMAGALVVVLAVILAWALLLNQQVRRQTAIIRDQVERQFALQKQYQNLFENAHDFICAHDLEGRFISFNPAGELLTGYAEAEALQMNIAQLLSPAHQGLSWIMEEGGSLRGENEILELEFVTRDQRTIICEVSRHLLWEQGRPSAVQCICRDVTIRRQAEEGLKQSQALYSSLVESLPQSIFRKDRQGRFTFANNRFCASLGRSMEEIIGHTDGDFFPAELADKYRRDDLRIIESGKSIEMVEEHLTQEGKRLWVNVVKIPVFDSRGEVVGAQGIFWDVTGQKQAQLALAKQAEELARSNEELEQFAYVASHDLQEPLRMISSYTQLLARRYKDRLDSDAHDFIRYAVSGASRMQQLINDLLAYSRVGTRGKERQLVDCSELLGEAIANLQAAIQSSGALVTNDELPQVWVDKTQLVQVFQNLICNGLKFRGQEPPRVHISASPGANDEWTFSVRDNGIGIDPRFHQRIFVIFQRLHGIEQYSGTGIGLAICKKVVERHGGRIWVESEPGTGTTFYFTLKSKSNQTIKEPQHENALTV
jgi:PAS domain S-box-containing protein